jgi:cation transport ATPase
MINWSSWRVVVGNAQGGCFASVMTLAGVEVRRLKRSNREAAEHLNWIGSLTTGQINSTLAQAIQRQEFRVETPSLVETQAGFGVRAVSAGRTVVFETARWNEPVIGLDHAMTTEENRRKVLANLAVIVGVGIPNEEVNTFIQSHPIQLLVEDEFKSMMESEKTLPPA